MEVVTVCARNVSTSFLEVESYVRIVDNAVIARSVKVAASVHTGGCAVCARSAVVAVSASMGGSAVCAGIAEVAVFVSTGGSVGARSAVESMLVAQWSHSWVEKA